MRETLAITDRAYILYDGRILASGTAMELAHNPKAREIYLGEKFSLWRESMAMEALSLRQTQRVVMTPLLQQAIQLLQLSTLELEEVVRKELQENPLLEELPPEGADAPATAARTPRPSCRPRRRRREPVSERDVDGRAASAPTTCRST